MQAGRWIAVALGVFLMAAGAVAGSSYALDVFGMLRDPTGRALSVQYNERAAKYFLNQRYVPANFNALLVGGSSTSNWPMEKLDFARFYNESLYGANTVEEKRLVDQALKRGHFRYAICVINPYLLESHDVKETDSRDPKLEALGSLNLLREEFYMALRHITHGVSVYSPDGGQKLVAKTLTKKGELEWTFVTDAVALRAFQEMLEELRASGTHIIFLETPVREDVYEANRAKFDRFYAEFPLRKPGEVLIDFDEPEYKELRSDGDRWVDTPHLNDASAAAAAEELNRAIHKGLQVSPR